jgi:hypothetical protein
MKPTQRIIRMKPKNNPLRIVQLVFVLTAAVWLGGAVFFTFVAGPMFFAPELVEALPKPRDGLVAQELIHRFTAFQLSLATIAALALLAGWRLDGGKLPRTRGLLLMGLVALIVFGLIYITPRLEWLHQLKYPDYFKIGTTPEQTAYANKSFGPLHGISQVGNLVVLFGLVAQLVLAWKAAVGQEGKSDAM